MAGIAMVDGAVVDARAYSVNAWADLQTRVRRGEAQVTMPFCHCNGHQSISVLATQFFKHYASSPCIYANGGGESEEHIFAKHEAAAGVVAAGWSPVLEAVSPPGAPRWRADVLATGPQGERIAFEIQRSRLSTSEYRERTSRYSRQGIDSVWFVDGDPQGRSRADLTTPAFDIEIGFDYAEVTGLGELATTRVPLREFTRRWLGGWRPAWPGERTVPEAEGLAFLPPPPQPPPVQLKWAPRENDLPSRGCTGLFCDGFQLWSSILEAWVCMKCRMTDSARGPQEQR